MPQITITVRKDGPYRVELAEGADFALVDHEGKPVPIPGPRFSLCRCGASSKKPFCDGTHSKIGFKGAEEAARRFDAEEARSAGTGNEGTGTGA
jgi:CDGSH-type Zn-finger protein